MIKLHNTLSGLVEEFKPINDTKVNFYCCGPTVYNDIHVGNARPLVVFDTVRRFLIFMGYDVKYVFNFTDVDDKIINKANESGITSNEVAEKYIERFKDVATRLGIYDYDNINPRATEHMDEIIDFIKGLIEKGAAYESDGDVYFDTTKAKDYGKLSKKNIDDLISGLRVDINEKKKNPLDFALWKKAKPNEPHWASPWSDGRPGWHIECSAMSRAILGDTLDIHAGGSDLEFPHHENEIQQSEALTGKPFAKYWLHNGMVNVDGKKMSKSLGNFILLKDLLDDYDKDTVRFFILSTHYRKPMNFTKEGMEGAKNSVKRIHNALKRLEAIKDTGKKASDEIIKEVDSEVAGFIAAMSDDFNTADALTCIFNIVKIINKLEDDDYESAKYIEDKLNDLLKVLGLDDSEAVMREDESDASLGEDEDKIKKMIDERNEARMNKDYAKADKIRDDLLAMGIKIIDSKDGQRWEKI